MHTNRAFTVGVTKFKENLEIIEEINTLFRGEFIDDMLKLTKKDDFKVCAKHISKETMIE